VKQSALRGIKKLATILVGVVIAAFIAATNLMAGSKEHQAGVTFLPDDLLMPALLKDLGDARQDITCALYMFKTDGNTNATGRLLNAMLEARKRDVPVTIIFDMGDKNELTSKYNQATAKTLKQAGVNVIFDDPDRRMHAKMCIIDESISFIGSHNYTYSAMQRNSEATVRVSSPEVAAEALIYMKGIK
jgi:phosphatidylserine/phosphatidylglycerophosphate/cardiolipin synthase-like enzyme